MIPEFKKILFTTDLSENARQSFYYAASMAIRYNAEIIVLHVLNAGSETIYQLVKNALGEEDWQRMQKRNQQEARNLMIGKRSDYKIIQQALNYMYYNDRGERTDEKFDAMEILIAEGNVAEQILLTVEEKRCDLIVMGAHEGLLHKKLIGSIAKEVMKRTVVPVLMIPSSKIS